MAIISSISGLRGLVSELKPDLLLDYTLRYISSLPKKKVNIALGKDGRLSSEPIYNFIKSALLLSGRIVYSLGLVGTPTLAQYIKRHELAGGIMVSASHNPEQYNGLKFFNSKGEYIDYDLREIKLLEFKVNLGEFKEINSAISEQVIDILKLKLVKKEAIRKRGLKIVVDVINSSGKPLIKELFKALSISNYILINEDINKPFKHNPEPLSKNLVQLCKAVKAQKADLGLAVDPDVDRLVIVDETGKVVIEENTLVLISQYVLENYKLDSGYKKLAVSNLSSTRALADICKLLKADYRVSKVGELNVVSKMKESGAIIGGEGNGGIIYPELHYGRDALVGIALLLSYLANTNQKISELLKKLPKYYFVKEKIDLKNRLHFDDIKKKMRNYLSINEEDGLRLDWNDAWLHLRRSNTEPIIRLYGEGKRRAVILKRIRELKKII